MSAQRLISEIFSAGMEYDKKNPPKSFGKDKLQKDRI
jgi:hypothetical protein